MDHLIEEDGITSSIIFQIGPVQITETIVTMWVIMALLGTIGWFVTRQLRVEPGPTQTAIEGIVVTIEKAISQVEARHSQRLLPFIASLWLFLIVANLCGLIPGVHSPTRDLSATAGLAFIVFMSVHWFGIRIQGIKPYLRHYLKPNPILLPFHLISEITRTVALAIRLFGNMMSLEMAALLILLVAGFLAPVPILMLHVVEALVQAYLFGMLALIFLAGGIQSHQYRKQSKE